MYQTTHHTRSLVSLTRSGLVVAIAMLGMAGCKFVQLTDNGASVAQAGSGDVANCTKVGEVDAQTRDAVVLRRGLDKVQEELTTLARNRAADLGANAIVPIGAPKDGGQRFLAYSCPSN